MRQQVSGKRVPVHSCPFTSKQFQDTWVIEQKEKGRSLLVPFYLWPNCEKWDNKSVAKGYQYTHALLPLSNLGKLVLQSRSKRAWVHSCPFSSEHLDHTGTESQGEKGKSQLIPFYLWTLWACWTQKSGPKGQESTHSLLPLSIRDLLGQLAKGKGAWCGLISFYLWAIWNIWSIMAGGKGHKRAFSLCKRAYIINVHLYILHFLFLDSFWRQIKVIYDSFYLYTGCIVSLKAKIGIVSFEMKPKIYSTYRINTRNKFLMSHIWLDEFVNFWCRINFEKVKLQVIIFT